MTGPIPLESLGTRSPLGKGGTAIVYRLPEHRSSDGIEVVYKEYKAKIRRSAGRALLPGLLNIVSVRTRLPDESRRHIDARAVWPTDVVIDETGDAVGILMRIIPDDYFQELTMPSGTVSRAPRELNLLFNSDDDARKLGLPVASIADRLQILAQTAVAFGLVHKNEVVLGDISPRNLVYTNSRSGRTSVLLVDCDSVRVRGSGSPFGGQPHTPRWEPPESLTAKSTLRRLRLQPDAPRDRLAEYKSKASVQSKATDVYKFGLMVVRTLDYGRMRSANRDALPAKRLLSRHVSREAAQLLDASLAPKPEDRPAMRDWYEVMSGRSRRSPNNGSAEGTPAVKPNPSPRSPSANWQWVDGSGWQRV